MVPEITRKHVRSKNLEVKEILLMNNTSAHQVDQELTSDVNRMDQNVIQNVKVTQNSCYNRFSYTKMVKLENI